MFALNLPAFDYKIKETKGKKFIFDSCRSKYVALTPEEWVRQHFCHYLTHDKHYPAGRIANEYSILQNGLNRRCDTVFFGTDLLPLMIVEYKAPEVDISQKVFDQIIRYNWTLKVRYLVVSNGLKHYCCQIDYEHNRFIFLKDIPDYMQL